MSDRKPMYQAVISSWGGRGRAAGAEAGGGGGLSYLTVGVDGRAQQLPGAPPPVHPQHPQDLQEAQAAQRRGQHVALVTHGHHGHRGDEHEDVCDRGGLGRFLWAACTSCLTQHAERLAGELQTAPPAFVAAAAAGGPDAQGELRPEDEDGEGLLATATQKALPV